MTLSKGPFPPFHELLDLPSYIAGCVGSSDSLGSKMWSHYHSLPSAAEGGSVDATQEMVALGLCNMASSLVHSMPVSGALSRGAVNHASGVASPAAGLYTGALVLLALQYFTPYFYYIPKASLAAVIIAAVVFMMELHVFKPIWRTKSEFFVSSYISFDLG